MIRPEKAADLFSAKPDQGMNRSADQVRATCRVYVDAGRLPDEGLESIIRLFNPGYAEGMMLAILLCNVFAPLIDHCVSPTASSRTRSGRR